MQISFRKHFNKKMQLNKIQSIVSLASQCLVGPFICHGQFAKDSLDISRN